QEMLDFCPQNGLTADSEMIAMDGVNPPYHRDEEGRCEVSLRHRYGDVEGMTFVRLTPLP
ncbi:hypothetical protein, partial [Sphingomonas sanguinis]|uniref:hypothetical protein n=1 Tax=Sphingomonas sanguinis TaxID=33051 RepID=UPI001F4CD2AF